MEVLIRYLTQNVIEKVIVVIAKKFSTILTLLLFSSFMWDALIAHQWNGVGLGTHVPSNKCAAEFDLHKWKNSGPLPAG